MGLGSTQPLNGNEYQEGVKVADNVTTILGHCHVNFLEPSGHLGPVMGTEEQFRFGEWSLVSYGYGVIGFMIYSLCQIL